MPEVYFTHSDLKHGLSQTEITSVLNDPNKIEKIILSSQGHEAKYVTGDISQGDKIELMYEENPDGSICVFHAMRIY